MRLEKPYSADDKFHLVMTPVEWKEIHALAKFAQVCLAYDCRTAYVAQILTYLVYVGQFGGFSQPANIQSDQNMQAAFAAVDRLAETASTDDVLLSLRKEEMRQLLIILGKASEAEDRADHLNWDSEAEDQEERLNCESEAEDQVERLNYADPEKVPYSFPDLEFASDYYGDALYALLIALHEDKSLTISRPSRIV
jgi:hypothetical protein